MKLKSHITGFFAIYGVCSEEIKPRGYWNEKEGIVDLGRPRHRGMPGNVSGRCIGVALRACRVCSGSMCSGSMCSGRMCTRGDRACLPACLMRRTCLRSSGSQGQAALACSVLLVRKESWGDQVKTIWCRHCRSCGSTPPSLPKLHRWGT